ncbi:branched-chain amino acid transporter permease [Gordonibacter massiliensis (ex Traore et al. 2017)]|uniref:AzlD domain-containing protein n=1 Tax=Gordonibacter massiliensis (ex Traore et al. 2017) TaxID=1841863 RepID=A0A842JK80_9ACTN|nr:AzlD domain-containing protein [Gordonibacter massiliensis (ex Traore et al. 2017)]MBC2889609.1 AzlD domain-containing protein [Gordonibacter massiliensis (ex Traore et al. 2017)]MBX9033162.1 branched-chain amino acid ABC transporter [Gordonibacter massiliensis (ex Traore et al. 2017)]
MSALEMLVMIAAGALATQITRWASFLAFPTAEKTPKVVTYLGTVLPATMWGLLIVYCFRTSDPLSGYHMAPELLAAAVVVGLHLWKRNMSLSMIGGTLVYMLLIRTVFPLA